MLFNKKILILVLSSYKHPYNVLMDAQHKTWFKKEESDVETFFYCGDLPKAYPSDFMQCPNNVLQFSCSDEYYMMHWKFKLALDQLWDHEWDIIFRTNSSSYVNKRLLKTFVATLPLEKIYGGSIIGPDVNDDGGYFVSGAGMFLSRDYANILRGELKNRVDIEEDVLIGRILRKHGVRPFDEQSRVDYPLHPERWHSTYHTRFKTGNREHDAKNMISFHQRISNG